MVEGDTALSVNTGQVQALARALAILDALASADGPLSLRDIANCVGLPRSTCHRLLTTMQSLSYVRFESDSREWHVGRQAFSVGSAFLRARNLGSISRPMMKLLSTQIQETVNLSRIENGKLTYFEQATSKQPVMSFARPGAVAPPHTTAAGKAILAHLPLSEQEKALDTIELRPKTTRSIQEVGSLLSDLHESRDRGFAIDNEENCVGIRCIAVPIFDETGRPCAALSVSGGINRIPRERFEALATALQAKAVCISREIGFSAA